MRNKELYCENENTSWATVDDLYARCGEEYIDKLSTRSNYDHELGTYVADETKEGRFRVTALALCDARDLLKRKIACKFGKVELLDSKVFSAIKQWHIKLTIETLKAGGDCSGCACVTEIDQYLDCGVVCSDDGACLPSNKTFFSISKSKFPCEGGGCGCC